MQLFGFPHGDLGGCFFHYENNKTTSGKKENGNFADSLPGQTGNSGNGNRISQQK